MNLLPLTLLLALPPEPLKAGNHHRSVEVGGRTRTYQVHVPPSYDPKKPTPVVLVFHGALANGGIQKFFCGLDQKADQAGFLAVYPDGTGANGLALVWDAFGVAKALGGKKADDVAFVARLLDDLAAVANVDPKRVYATGMSNGAMMSYRLAAELSDRIAAIAPVGGTMVVAKCEPKRPVPVLHFHGTEDAFAPFDGKYKNAPAFVKVRPIEETLALWAKVNGCDGKVTTAVVEDGKADGLKVTRKSYGTGKGGAEVILYLVEGGGHTWPGRDPIVGFLGKSTRRVSANDLMWEFFKKHPMK